jgi:hypothetical protein
MKRLLLLAVFLFLTGFVFSVDYGGAIEEKVEADDVVITNTIGLSPWFSWNANDDLSLYLSGILSINYNKYSDELSDYLYSGWVVVPELSLFMVNYRIDEGRYIEAGRIGYSDNLNFTASGLFDGASFKVTTSGWVLNTGLYFTGLLYKETAKVVMTAQDKLEYNIPWGGNSDGKYFASRRLFATGRLDMPFPFYEPMDFSAELLLQFDLNGGVEQRHSQYLQAKVEFYPLDMLRVTGGLLIEAMESNYGDVGAAFGFLAQGKMALSATDFNDFVGLTLKFTTASTDALFTAFTPITSTPQGNVFSQSLSGLFLISADYTARIIESLYVEGALRYFIRTYGDLFAEGYLYGAEIWAYAAWRPFEDLRASFGAGVFFPSLGNKYPPETDVMWKVTFGLAMFL